MFDWIKNFFVSTIRQFGAIICQWIYNLISWLYELFMTITKVNILSSDDIQPIYERVTMILTIVMVFYITFEVVKYVVSPDTINDKEKGAGGIMKRMIIVIILIAFVPRIFTIAYDLQSKIVNNQVVSKIIVGKSESNYENFSGDFSANLLSLFYNIDETACASAKKDDCTVAKKIVPQNLEKLRNKEKIDLVQGMNKFGTITENGEEKDVPIIEFDGMALIVGLFVVYIFVLYCIDLGLRYGQLLFLQVMAPIAIIGYISPGKDGMFQRWTKQCLTTYIDLFIRMAVINFILLIINVLWKGYESGSLFTNLGEVAPSLKVFTYIALVLGLLLFAKKAPDMLKDLLGKGGGVASIGYGLGASKRVAPTAARAIGAGLGASRLIGGAAARGINTHRRNKEKGYESRLTARGREQHKQRKAERTANRNAYKSAKADLRNARKNYRNMTGELTDVEKAQDNLNQARNKIAQSKNERHRSVIGNTAVGGIQAGWTGARTGFQATKLEDISKKVKEGYKKDVEQIQQYEKYIEAGGAGGVTGYVDRKITGLEKTIGIQTRAGQVASEIKTLDSKISKLKQQSAVEASVLKNSDEATNANHSKILDGKQKQTIEADVNDANVITLANDLGMNANDIAGKKLTDVYIKADADAKSLKIRADELEKAAKNDPTLSVQAKQAQENAIIAEQKTKKIGKTLAEYANSQILRTNINDRATNGNFEQGAVVAINSSIQRLKDAAAEPDTYNRLLDQLAATNGGRNSTSFIELQNALNNPDNITDFKILDKLAKSLKTISSVRDSETQQLENAKNRLSTGEYRSEVQANDDMSGKNGK